MGTWGYRPFENDGASDWAWELSESDDDSVLREALAGVVGLSEDEYLEAPDAENAIAAADVIASAKGQACEALPGEIQAWLGAHPDVVTDYLVQAAVIAVERVLTNSELQELWLEAEEEPWFADTRELLARLRAAAA